METAAGATMADSHGAFPTRILRARHQVQPLRIAETIMSFSKQHKRKLAAAIKKMGTSLATHKQSTFKPSGAGSKTLEEFKARRAAEKSGLLPPPPAPGNANQYEPHKESAQVTELPVRAKARSA
jgi:hypothetical protein